MGRASKQNCGARRRSARGNERIAPTLQGGGLRITHCDGGGSATAAAADMAERRLGRARKEVPRRWWCEEGRTSAASARLTWSPPSTAAMRTSELAIADRLAPPAAAVPGEEEQPRWSAQRKEPGCVVGEHMHALFARPPRSWVDTKAAGARRTGDEDDDGRLLNPSGHGREQTRRGKNGGAAAPHAGRRVGVVVVLAMGNSVKPGLDWNLEVSSSSNVCGGAKPKGPRPWGVFIKAGSGRAQVVTRPKPNYMGTKSTLLSCPPWKWKLGAHPSPGLEPVQGEVGDDAVANKEQRHDADIHPMVLKPDSLDGRELRHGAHRPAAAAFIVPAPVGELYPKQQPVAVEAVVEPPEPADKRRDMLHVVATGDEEHHGDDGSQGRPLLDVHEHGTDGEPQALGDEHGVEDDEEGEEEGGRARVQAAHPVEDEHERRRQAELHGEVGGRARREVGGEPVHAGGALLEEEGALQGEDEDGVVEREEAPEDGEEEDERRAVLEVGCRRAPPEEAGEGGHAEHLEDPELVEGLVAAFFEAAPEEDGELGPPAGSPFPTAMAPPRWSAGGGAGGGVRGGADVEIHCRRNVALVRG
ncbi:hypothetical protein BRADI_3g16132v3 [Brachypodium distachyon]|uniref:Uncharacterized protein n=1 Tax=Brachypodium distachyon TaxID=15368 RepID=A0A2K2CXG6_BRADI|nr:hypothetical protein BRADI_3g16132v3 [Brachypodium distachyon]